MPKPLTDRKCQNCLFINKMDFNDFGAFHCDKFQKDVDPNYICADFEFFRVKSNSRLKQRISEEE